MTLTPFDTMMITEAYQRCYGLRAAVRSDSAGALDELAHQTGLRIPYLRLCWEEVKGL